MSQKLVDLNPDLRRLRDAGYNVDVQAGYLLIGDIPYVDANKQVRRGLLVSELSMSGDRTQQPSTHVVHFAGDYPCTQEGKPIEAVRNQSQRQQLAPGIVVDHAFSSKPQKGHYDDYFEKMQTYANILTGYAQAVDPSVSPLFFSPLPASNDESVFHYVDTASSRAGIVQANQKLMLDKVAIVGLGGTGAYILDLLAKVPIAELHLFDGDKFLQHNAFRAPGAPSIAQLAEAPLKVDYLTSIYSRMRRGIVPHQGFVGRTEVQQLVEMDFVFLSLDSGPAKKMIIETLQAQHKSFIDVGLGIELVDDVLTGMARVTTCTDAQQSHVWDCVSCADNAAENVYAKNIQIAELNALNASLAVIQWKKLRGFYFDPVPSFNSTYVVSTNRLLQDVVNREVAA